MSWNVDPRGEFAQLELPLIGRNVQLGHYEGRWSLQMPDDECYRMVWTADLGEGPPDNPPLLEATRLVLARLREAFDYLTHEYARLNAKALACPGLGE